MSRRVIIAALAALFSAPALAAPPMASPEEVASAKAILGRSVAYRTVEGQGQVPAYAAYLADLLIKGGFAAGDVSVERLGETAMLIARYKGTGKQKPILLAGHMDVVEARDSDWQRPPFTMVEEGGFLFGRGVLDNKFGVTMMVATLLRLKAEGFRPSRDLVLVLSGDEETQMRTTRILAKRFPDAAFLLNSDAGGGALDDAGKPLGYGLQAAEKTYADYRVSVTNPGGHSSRPGPVNAIVQLAGAITKVGAYRFKPQSNELTRAYFSAIAGNVGGALGAAMARYAKDPGDTEAAALISADPEFIGQVRTTCVPTLVDGGHALNALPQRASFSINCRIFPGVSVAQVKAELTAVMDDPSLAIEVLDDPVASDASPLRADVMAAVRKAVDQRFPGLTIVPQMSAGATDSLHFRNAGIASFGVDGLFMNPRDDYAHGLNERVPVDAIPGALNHWHMLLTTLAR